MISHSHKAIYLHIGKTAGTSVENMLCGNKHDFSVPDRTQMFGYDQQEGIFLQHATAETIRRMSGDEIFSQYYKFTVVRNPFARSISVYHYLKKQHDKQFGSFENYVKKLPELVSQPVLMKGTHYIAQVNYTHIDAQCICDHISHFESLPHSLDPVRDVLGIVKPLGKYNYHRTQHWKERPISDFYTEEMLEVMQKVYANDFEAYGYSNDPNDVRIKGINPGSHGALWKPGTD
jgi:hypothetical protein